MPLIEKELSRSSESSSSAPPSQPPADDLAQMVLRLQDTIERGFAESNQKIARINQKIEGLQDRVRVLEQAAVVGAQAVDRLLDKALLGIGRQGSKSGAT